MLVQIDCDKYQAELAVAIAEHEAKDAVYKNNVELGKLNAVSKVDLETSGAEAKKALAAIRVASQCERVPDCCSIWRSCRQRDG